MDLNNLELALVCVWFAYGIRLGFKNTLILIGSVVTRQEFCQNSVGKLLDTSWLALSGYLYLTLIH